MLQSSATLRLFGEAGCEAELINYTTPDLVSSNKIIKAPVSKRAVIDDVRNVLMLKSLVRRRAAFNEYREKYYRLSSEEITDSDKLSSVSDKYDLYVTGSDQTFNLHLRGDSKYREPFFLPFTEKPKISFASSMGDSINEITDAEKDYIKTALDKYRQISVRDVPTKEYLSDILGKQIALISDPTVCVEREFWDNMVSRSESDGYILFYSVVSSPRIVEKVEQIGKTLGLPVVAPHFPNQFELKSRFVRKSESGPVEFLNLINNASLVLTTSFHATVFSLLFHKPFYSFVLGEGNRIKSLLGQAGLEKMILDESSDIRIDEIPQINFEKVDEFFESERKRAKSFISEQTEG